MKQNVYLGVVEMSNKRRVLGVEFLDQEHVVVSQQTTVSSVIVVYTLKMDNILLDKNLLKVINI